MKTIQEFDDKELVKRLYLYKLYEKEEVTEYFKEAERRNVLGKLSDEMKVEIERYIYGIVDNVEKKEIYVSKLLPWKRFVAKKIDLAITSSLLGLVLGITNLTFVIDNKLYVMLAALALFPIEAILISNFGTTIGKWMLNIVIRDEENKKITFNNSIKRSFFSYVKGLGLNIPIVTIFTLYSSYKYLIRNANTKWDEDYGINVEYREIGIKRKILLIAVIIIFTTMTVMFFTTEINNRI